MNKGRVACIVAGVVALSACVAALVVWGPELFEFFTDGQRLQSWVEAQGIFAPLAMILLVAAQIVIAVFPGEPVELGAGYAFGFWEGTFLCLVGGFLGSFLIVVLVRTLGMRIVRIFFTQEKIDSMKWLQDSARFEALLFALFLIPATPKDIMTYLAGLTKCPTWRICVITGIGRVPSIVSSTLAAGFAAGGNWGATFAVGALTVVLALLGGVLYAYVSKREKQREEAELAAKERIAALVKSGPSSRADVSGESFSSARASCSRCADSSKAQK